MSDSLDTHPIVELADQYARRVAAAVAAGQVDEATGLAALAADLLAWGRDQHRHGNPEVAAWLADQAQAVAWQRWALIQSKVPDIPDHPGQLD